MKIPFNKITIEHISGRVEEFRADEATLHRFNTEVLGKPPTPISYYQMTARIPEEGK